MARLRWAFLPILLAYGVTALGEMSTAVVQDLPRDATHVNNEYFLIVDDNPTTVGLKNYKKNIDSMRQLEYDVISVGGTVLNKYYLAFTGVHAYLTDEALAEIESLNNLKRIQPNEIAYLVAAEDPAPAVVRSWGLDRIDQRDLPLNNTYIQPAASRQTHVYVIDSGLRSTHSEFSGRVGNGVSTISDASTQDCLGHGTHVSGTILGASAGVFSKAIVHPVRVFGCTGSAPFDVILKGLEWVIAHHVKPAVANMSLGAATSSTVLDVAVKNTVAAGVTVAVAAGNANQDACTTSPAREPTAITVAASDNTDKRSSFSNFGSCVDIFAPGSNIVSAYISSDTAYATYSGTSMASPHVAGAAALVSAQHPTWTPQQVGAELIRLATPDKITDFKGSPNRLLYVAGFIEGSGLSVNAGADIVRTFPDSDVTLTGAASSSVSVIEGKWQQISGPTQAKHVGVKNDANFVATFKKLAVGSYVFRLTVTDASGVVAFDDVNVAVRPNSSPLAHAGDDETINPQGNSGAGDRGTLDATRSSDPEENIVAYHWEVVSGDPEQIIVSDYDAPVATVVGKVAGDYIIRLTVTDAEGLTSSDDKVLTINAAPVAHAGADFEVAYPATSFFLDGSAEDADGDHIDLIWWQLNGPTRVNLANHTTPHVVITNFVPGVYTFRLTAFDEHEAVSSDDVKVTIK